MQLIKSLIELQPELQDIRRDLHAHPELGYEEHRTSEAIAQKLAEWGIPVLRGIGETGVVGVLIGGNSDRAIGLRADMDALPMQELNTFAHASKNPGKMHACGHDGHVAMLLGAAHYLSQHGNFDGTVYLIFQPAEEGGGGAKRMIDAGLFEQCRMQAVFGMHNWPGTPVGNFGVTAGPMMASSNEFEVIIKGKGSHAAQPHMGIDPVMIAVQIAQSWQTIVSRNQNPLDPAVLSITQIHAGSATNVIPDEASLIGTVRTFSVEALDLIEKRMEEIALHTATAFGASVDFRFHRNYPPLINHEDETKFAIDVMRSMVGAAKVDTRIEPTMGAEDFAFMLQHKPGCYVFIGNGGGDHRVAGHGMGPCNIHNPSYDFNDELLPIGATYWVRLVEAYLKKHDERKLAGGVNLMNPAAQGGEMLVATASQASLFSHIALTNIRREFPNKLDHVLNDRSDLRSPRELHPAFYGSYDWHSSVHMHWLLARSLRLFPDLPERAEIIEVLDQHLSNHNIAAEITHLRQPSRQTFERTYGWAWLLKLQAELIELSAAGSTWRASLQPLADVIVERFEAFLPRAQYPVRTGTHGNSAFSLFLALDYAKVAQHLTLQATIVDKAQTWFGRDRSYAARFEPSGDEFLSGGLMEAALMRRVLGGKNFRDWWQMFCPLQADFENWLTPVSVSDREDPVLSHLDGLNLSRAWCWKLIAGDLPESMRASIRPAIDTHLGASLPHATRGSYAGTHWLASFALLALSEQQLKEEERP